MPVERFFIDAPLEGLVTLEGPEHHHLAHVLRIRVGEEVELVNGRGSLAKAKVESISRTTVLRVLSSEKIPLQKPHLQLAIPLMRPAKLELVIEKCTELGADAFFLYPAHFSEKEDLSDHQWERLQHIAISAMKQCGRLDLPPLHRVSFAGVLALPDPLFFGDLHTDEQPVAQKSPLVFVTGPEKGFFNKETQALRERGQGVRLHKNILRAETAPIAASVLYTIPLKH